MSRNKDDEHFPANHRGDDIDTIGSFPCECINTIADRTIKKLDACADALTAFEWAFAKVIGERK